jgi:hypothetical protein
MTVEVDLEGLLDDELVRLAVRLRHGSREVDFRHEDLGDSAPGHGWRLGPAGISTDQGENDPNGP